MATPQNVKDAVTALSSAFSAGLTTLQAAVASEISAVTADIANLQSQAGGPTAADLDGVVTSLTTAQTNITTAITGVQATVDAETAKIAGSAPPPPPPPTS